MFVALKYTPFISAISQVTKVKGKYIFLFISLVFAFGLISTSLNYIDLYTVKLAVENNEVQKIKGCIANYEVNQSNSRSESFSISGIAFKYNDYGTEKYFFANRQHDSFIKNGRCVVIAFIPSSSNNIIKIDKV